MSLVYMLTLEVIQPMSRVKEKTMNLTLHQEVIILVPQEEVASTPTSVT